MLFNVFSPDLAIMELFLCFGFFWNAMMVTILPVRKRFRNWKIVGVSYVAWIECYIPRGIFSHCQEQPLG